MPTRWLTIAVTEDNSKRLKAVYQRRSKELYDRGVGSFTGFVNDLIWHIIEADEALTNGGGFLSEVSVMPEGIVIKDDKLGRIAVVRVVNGELMCDIDNSNNCIHVGFAYAIPKVYNILNTRGYRVPKVQG